MVRRSAAIIGGLVLVPALAVVATVLATSQRAPATSTTPVVATTESTTTTTTTPLADDLRRACGPDGMMLVQAEAAGVITPLQQSALDALRPLCARAGLPLPGPPRGR